MRHDNHLLIQTALLVIIVILIFNVTGRQDAKIQQQYTDILSLIEKQQANLQTEQTARTSLARELYNHKTELTPEPTMGTITIKIPTGDVK